MIDANAHATTTACKIRQAFKILCDGLIVVMSRVRDIFAKDMAMMTKIWQT